jgi:N-methylhydantoinase B/oxoprolinase/acetone carboxylase alpha subunit
MNNVALGGRYPARGRPFAYYGTVSGGPEAPPTGPVSRPSTPTSQIMNTPVKALHMAQPLATLERPIGRGSGREGRRSGWGGMVRPWELVALAPVTTSWPSGGLHLVELLGRRPRGPRPATC